MMPGRSALFPAAAYGIAGFVQFTIMADWPDGDPDGAREAAVVWRSLGDQIDRIGQDATRVASRVWTEHPSQGTEAFQAVWQGAPSGGVGTYPREVANYCRRVAQGCEDYADALESAQRALRAMAYASWAQLLFAASWPWTGSLFAKWLIDRLHRKVVAQVLLRALERTLGKIVTSKMESYVVGSAVFALGDEALAVAARGVNGVDQGSLGDNALATLKDFGACLVFFGVWDLTKLGPMQKVFRNNDLGDYASFYAGSTAYTIAYNVESGKTGTDVLPTTSQLVAKLLIGTGQRGKDPGYPPKR
ncbi:hypothetical protein Sru01_03240 [Sphaerisporangium rufum]|uniref:Outer membrane channel protein CpnT-like N-terminal domain-containing protein n=1 Tax=Sphaerisporangium rufum TaxID=1381558 RepID=A0A919UYP8_9ACTN|nr:hypothetical protein [Sphaerisporangium rufum]GII75342.1 hypothetical protein Sru01_03240 [Sphaerisporangium rufum]